MRKILLFLLIPFFANAQIGYTPHANKEWFKDTTQFDKGVRIRAGNPSTGKVWTAKDNSGLGEWANGGTTIDTSNFWNINGNAGTNSATNFIGTTDYKDLKIKRNGNTNIQITTDDKGEHISLVDSVGNIIIDATSLNGDFSATLGGDSTSVVADNVNGNVNYYAAVHNFSGNNSISQIIIDVDSIYNPIDTHTYIGTPIFRLKEVNSLRANFTGAVSIADGTQANGYVLTSDANGLAHWDSSSGGSCTCDTFNLQQVTDEGNTTTTQINVRKPQDTFSYIVEDSDNSNNVTVGVGTGLDGSGFITLSDDTGGVDFNSNGGDVIISGKYYGDGSMLTGVVGVTGATGATGSTGATGVTGATGATGTTVPNALTFSYGITGATSYDGSVAQTIKADTSTSGINLATQGYADRGDVWVLLSTVTASNSATVDFTGLSSTYTNYKVVINDLVPATNATTLWARVGTGGTPTYQSGGTDYSWTRFFSFVTTTGTTYTSGGSGDGNDAQIQVGTNGNIPNSGSGALSAEIKIFNPSQSTKFHYIDYEVSFTDIGANHQFVTGQGVYLSTTAVTAFRLQMSSGNIASGTVKTYGLK